MEGDGSIMLEKRSLKVSILMLIVAIVVVYLITRLLDGFFIGLLNRLLGFSVNLIIVLVIIWKVLIWMYYKKNVYIIKQLNSLFLRLVSTHFVILYFYPLLKLIRFCG